MPRAPLRRERLPYTPAPGFPRLGAAPFLVLFAAIPLAVDALDTEWGLVVSGVGFLALATLLWGWARWNKRHPERHARIREAEMSRSATHPVRQVVISTLTLTLTLPLLVWQQVWGFDDSPSVPVLVVAGLVGTAGGAALGAWAVRFARKRVGRTGHEPLSRSDEEGRPS